MKVLFIARYLQAINQKKLVYLSQEPGLELWHLVPAQWHDTFNRYQVTSERKPTYQQIAHPVINAPDIHRFLYWPPPTILHAIQPDLIHLEEEPESLVALEIVLLRRWLAPRAKLILFTWQNIRRKTNLLVQAIARFNLANADGIIAGNRDAMEVIRTYGFKGPGIVLPQLGLDPDDFSPAYRQEKRAAYHLDRFTVGYIGRLAEEKGIPVLLDAVRPLTDVQTILIGTGPLLASLQTLSDDPAWKDRLVLTGSLSHVETARMLAALDVLVLPSLTRPYWKEQFGHVLIEAMAAGVPVIGSDSGAIPEVISDAGLIVPEGNAAALHNTLILLQADLTLRVELSAKGRARVLTHYTHQHIVEQTVAFYRQIF